MKINFSIIFKSAVTIVAMAAMLLSCTPADESNVEVSSVQFKKKTSMLFVGQSASLKVTVIPENATDQTLFWESDNAEVATVTPEGVVTAISEGTAHITARSVNDKKDECVVTVHKAIVAVTGVSLNKTQTTIFLGKATETLVATVAPGDASNKNVTWTSGNPDIVTVDANGTLTAIAVGEADVTVKTEEGEFTATCKVTVDASEFKVKFETNGAAPIDDVIVEKGKPVTEPAVPVKEGGLDPGLYLGKVDPDSGAYTFTGWYKDEGCTQKYDFSTPVVQDITLYAGYDATISAIEVPVPEGGSEDQKLANAVTYLQTLTFTEKTEYTYVVTEDNKWQNTVNFVAWTHDDPKDQAKYDMMKHLHFYIVGRGDEHHTLTQTGGNLIQAGCANIYIGKSIRLSGASFGSWAVAINVHGGNVTMLPGSEIANCNSTWRGVIFLNDGASTMTLDGAKIYNNTLASKDNLSGLITLNWGNLIIKDTEISGNTITNEEGAETSLSAPIVCPHGRSCKISSSKIFDNTTTSAKGFGSNGIIVGTPSKISTGVFKIDSMDKDVTIENIGSSLENKTGEDVPSPWVRIN